MNDVLNDFLQVDTMFHQGEDKRSVPQHFSASRSMMAKSARAPRRDRFYWVRLGWMRGMADLFGSVSLL